MLSRNRFLFFAGVPIAFVAMGTFAVSYVDNTGGTFFSNGKEMLGRLGHFSQKLKARDYRALESFYSPQFQGQRLGLNNLKQVDLKDGIHRLVLTGDSQPVGREGAVNEWRTYLESFASIQEASLHIHRLINWRSHDVLSSANCWTISI